VSRTIDQRSHHPHPHSQMRASQGLAPGSKMRANVLEVLKAEATLRGYASVEQPRGQRARDRAEIFRGEPVILATIAAGI